MSELGDKLRELAGEVDIQTGDFTPSERSDEYRFDGWSIARVDGCSSHRDIDAELELYAEGTAVERVILENYASRFFAIDLPDAEFSEFEQKLINTNYEVQKLFFGTMVYRKFYPGILDFDVGDDGFYNWRELKISESAAGFCTPVYGTTLAGRARLPGMVPEFYVKTLRNIVSAVQNKVSNPSALVGTVIYELARLVTDELNKPIWTTHRS